MAKREEVAKEIQAHAERLGLEDGPREDLWASGGKYDTSTVTKVDRAKCFVSGHDVHGWGTGFGWCRRCKHTVWTYDRKSVLYHGEYHRYPPPHKSAIE